MKRWSIASVLVFSIVIIGPAWITGCISHQEITLEELARRESQLRHRVQEDSIRTAQEAEQLALLAEERRRRHSVERRLVEDRETQRQEASAEELRRMALLSTIYFDYDEYKLRDDQFLSLSENVQKLREFRPEDRILIEGHCDERGTVEYNLALGERRAGAVKSYLGDGGLDESRIEIISYGEEKPADMGHDEQAWSKNRRAELKRTEL